MTQTQIKKCTKCGEEKPFSEFSPHKAARFGLQPRCKKCCAAAHSAYYRANIEAEREKARLRSLAYYAENPERARASKRKWSEANREKSNAIKRAWRLANPEANQAAKEAWRKANQDRVNAKGREWKKNNPEAMRRFLLRKYGLTPETFEELFASQNNRCAICRTADFGTKGPCIDHNHSTGATRGVLCVKCNAGLGQFDDSKERLAGAITYLARHEERSGTHGDDASPTARQV